MTATTLNGLNRRGFLTVTGGLLIGLVLPEKSRLSGQEIGSPPPGAMATPPPEGKPNAYIHIGTDESVTFLIPKSEMGRGPTTACSQMLAEELECDWSKVRMEIAPVDPSSYGHQTTVGSRAVRTSWDPLRKAGAQARMMLIAAAAQKWGVDGTQCYAENGFVINRASGAKLSYGSLAADAAKLPVPANLTLKDPKDFRIIGKPLKRLDTREKVMGTAAFGIDARPEGLLYAVVERCPVFGGKPASFDATRAKAMPGVKDVVATSRGVAVVATNTWTALQARKALTIKWDEGAGASVSSASIRQMCVDRAKEKGAVARKEGNAESGLAKAAKKLEAVYEVPYLSHTTMEPMNCTVHVRPDGAGAEVWSSTQSPTTARKVVADALGLPPEKVTFHTMFSGGGFGRRGEGEIDYALEAAEVAKHFTVPVKVTYTREDDTQHSYYRPTSYVEFAGGLDAAGWPVALTAKVASPPFGGVRDGVYGTAVGGLSDLHYEIPDVLVDYRTVDTIVPVSFWRAPGASQNVFFLESFLDELAAAGGKDPVELRRRLLSKTPRLLNVLNIAAEKANWGKPTAGRFQGVAVGNNVDTFTAQVAEISVAQGKVRVHRVVCALDCGVVINPAILRQQIEGGIIFGLSAALKGEITLERGRVQQGNFNTYDVVRIEESPEIEVYIVPSRERPTGAGEATNPQIIPAVTNAIFAATGKRIRKLPIRTMNLA